MIIFTIIGIVTLIIIVLLLFIHVYMKHFHIYYWSEPINKELMYDRLDYEDTVSKEYFMEHYSWCNHGGHYYNGKDEYQCSCYAR
jgi:hypothetical protein